MEGSGWFVVAIIVALTFGFGLGYDVGRQNASDDCKAIGVFQHRGKVYDCHLRPAP